MPRQLKKDIISEYCIYASDTEVPDIFSMWCCITGVAACLGRNVWVDMGHFTIYPNLYVVLVAGSARCRKSTAVLMTRKLLSFVKPEVKDFSQKLTTEAFIKALAEYDIEEDGHTIEKIAEGILIADELGTLIDKKSNETGLTVFLTSLYDNHDSFTYETIKRGKLVVPKSCVSLLGGTTEQWLRETIPIQSIGQGFTSRIIFVYRARPDKFVPFPETTEENKERWNNLINDMSELRSLKGKYEFTQSAKDFYIKEYKAWFRRGLEDNQTSFLDDSRLSGYAGRRMVILIKIAIIAAASIRDELQITDVDMKIAKDILVNVEKFMPKVMNALTTGVVGDYTKEVLRLIQQWRTCSRSKVLQYMSHKLSARDLDVCIETLEQSKFIKVLHAKHGGTKYEFIGDSFTDKTIVSMLK
jgi:hypothetical protein